MNFDDIKDRIKAELQKAWESFQETSFYNQLRDRYENMTPAMQRLSIIATILVVVGILLSFPLSYYSSSANYMDEFLSKRSLIVDLLKAVQESQSVNTNDTLKADLNMLTTQIDTSLKNTDLSPDQVSPAEIIQEKSNIIPQNLNGGLIRVKLSKLNIRQVSDFGYQFQNLHPRLKLKDMIIEASEGLPTGYFNVTYKMINVAAQTPAPPPPTSNKNLKTRK